MCSGTSPLCCCGMIGTYNTYESPALLHAVALPLFTAVAWWVCIVTMTTIVIRLIMLRLDKSVSADGDMQPHQIYLGPPISHTYRHRLFLCFPFLFLFISSVCVNLLGMQSGSEEQHMGISMWGPAFGDQQVGTSMWDQHVGTSIWRRARGDQLAGTSMWGPARGDQHVHT